MQTLSLFLISIKCFFYYYYKINHVLRLSYKRSDEDEWKQIIKPPTEFRCRKNIAEPTDFCYDLKDLEYGKQYASKVSVVF